MADSGGAETKSAPIVEEQKPSKLQLEQLDRDEMTKQIKKQLMLLQRMKLKCDDLGKKNASLESELNEKDSECTELKGKLDLVENEKNDGCRKISSLELDNSNFSRKIKALEEQVECMALKHETANTTFQCLQDEINNCQMEKKALVEEVSILSAARDEALQSLKSIKVTLNSELANVKQELLKAQEDREKAIKTNENLLKELEISCSAIKDIESNFDFEQSYNELQIQYEALNKEHLAYIEEMQKLETSFSDSKQQLEDEKQNLMLQLQNYHEIEVEVAELRGREKSLSEVYDREVKTEMDEIKQKLEITLNEKLTLDEKVECIQHDFETLQLKLNDVELKNTALERQYCEVQSQKQALNEALLHSEEMTKLLDTSLTESKKMVEDLCKEMLPLTLEKETHVKLQRQLNDLLVNELSLQQKIDAQQMILTEIYDFACSFSKLERCADFSEGRSLFFDSSINLLQLLKDGANSLMSAREESECQQGIIQNLNSKVNDFETYNHNLLGDIRDLKSLIEILDTKVTTLETTPQRKENECPQEIIQVLNSKVAEFEIDNHRLLEDIRSLNSIVEMLDSKVTTLEASPQTELSIVSFESEKVSSASVCVGTSRIEMVDAFTEPSEDSDFQDFVQKLGPTIDLQYADGCGHNIDFERCVGKVDACTEISEDLDTSPRDTASNVIIERVERATEIDAMLIASEDCEPTKCTDSSSSVLLGECLVLREELDQKNKTWLEEKGVYETALVDYSNKVRQLRQKVQALEGSLQSIFCIVEESDQMEHRSDDVNAELNKLRLRLETLSKSSEESPELTFSDEIQCLDDFSKMLLVFKSILVLQILEWKAPGQLLTREMSVKEALTSDKAETLQKHTEKLEKDLKDAKELVNKYKNIAIKVKKEAAELKKQVTSISSEFEKTVEERDHFKSQIERMSSQVAIINKEKGVSEDKEKSIELQLTQEKDKHKITLSKLELALMEANKSNLISLEIADYERLMKDLNKQMESKTFEIRKLQTEIEFHKEKIDGYLVQIGQLEEQKLQSEARGNQLKALSVKLKAEIADLRKAEGEWKTVESSLLAQVEANSREIENYKVQITNTMADNQRLQESGRALQDSHSRSVRLLESRISGVVDELQKVKSDYASCQAEYEGYKVRVHSVLKHKKSKLGSSDSTPSGVGPQNADMNVDEKEHLEKAVEALQTRVQELVTQLTTVQSELEALQDEHDNLLQRHNKLVLNISEQDLSWKQRVERVQKDLLIEQKEHAEVLRQVQQQHQLTLNLSLKQQMEALHKEHSQKLEDLQLKLDLSQDELLRLQKEMADVKLSNPTIAKDEEAIVDILNTERQEGEGSEFTDAVFGTPQKTTPPPSSTFIPFDQLLNQDKLSVSSISTLETDKLENQLAVATKRIEHMTEILHESEATNARMTEQTRVLKEEIRRLERNQEREEHFANMEYVKNVIVKFFSLPSGDERERLVPVLTMLLRLSREEEHQMQSIAKGVVESPAMVGWGSYLPRWPGT